jgi:hypothetical protein
MKVVVETRSSDGHGVPEPAPGHDRRRPG